MVCDIVQIITNMWASLIFKNILNVFGDQGSL